jgi:putative endopeptidase
LSNGDKTSRTLQQKIALIINAKNYNQLFFSGSTNNPFFKMNTLNKSSSNKIKILVLVPSPPYTTINKKSYTSNEFIANYRAYIKKLIKTIDVKLIESSSMNDYVADVMSLEYHLQNLIQLDNRQKKINMSIKDFLIYFPHYQDFFEKFDATNVAVIDTVIILENANYFMELAKIFSEKNFHMIKNYCLWHLLSSSYKYFGGASFNESRMKEFDFHKEHILFNNFISLVPDYASTLYQEFSFNKSAQIQLNEMFEHLRSTAISRLRQSELMNNKMIEFCVNKLNNMILSLCEASVLNHYVLPRSSDLFELIDAIKETNPSNELNDVYQNQADKIYSFEVNAIYRRTENKLIVPCGIICPPFFISTDNTSDDPYEIKAKNYGTLGAIIAHEMMHSIDLEGIKYDETGAINKHRNFDLIPHLNQYQKILKQWKLFEEKIINNLNPHINELYRKISGGSNENKMNKAKLNELFADICGLKIAAYALDDLLKTTSKKKYYFKIFFESWSCLWRQKTNREYTMQLLSADTHINSSLRVNIPLAHVIQYYDTYGIPRDSSSIIYLNDKEMIEIV